MGKGVEKYKDFVDYIRNNYAKHVFISAKSLVSYYLIQQGISVYRRDTELISLKRSLTTKASFELRRLKGLNKICKYNAKQYKVI